MNSILDAWTMARRHARHALRAVPLAAVLLCAAGAADAQYFGQNKVQYRTYDWHSIRSDHFEVYSYGGLDSLAMRVLDLAEKTQEVLSRRMGHRLGRRVPIILYGSHNDFSQTNVTPDLIDAGTGGFTEVLRNRVVLPFTGSYEDLRHVVVHELTHAFMFDMLYGGSAAALIAGQSFFSVPLWFAEGMAEYLSLGMEPNAEMFLRDGVVEGYLPPLEYSGGYLVYKQGQSAVSYLVHRYGEERLRDLLKHIRRMHGFDRAFEKSVGMPVAAFDEQWRTWLRKRYWPTVAEREDPERFARRLTDHRHDQSHLNTSPAVSPQGDRIAYFSDRRQYTDVFIMSALDGKVQRRVIRGERNVKFEAIPSFRSALTWSPDGDRLALTAKSGGRDVLYIVSASNGKIERTLHIPCDAASFPAWSPVGDSIVVVGVLNGRSDLWLIDVASGRADRLTDDAYDEKEPTWHPSGRRITFASDRLAPVVLHPERRPHGFGAYAIYDFDLDRREVRKLLDTAGDDHAPAWSPDGERLAFVSDRSGAPNIYLYDTETPSFTRLTNVLGGVESLSWSRQNDRLVFSAFNRGGYDVFAVKEPLSVDAVVERLRRENPEAVLTVAEAARAPVVPQMETPRVAALAAPAPDSLFAAPDSAAGIEGTLASDSGAAADEWPLERHAPTWTMGGRERLGAVRDTTPAIAPTFALRDSGGPFAVPDSILGQKPSPYRAELAPEYAGGGFYASTGFGLAGSTQFVFSDFLGDHRLYLATDVFSGSFDDVNALAVATYLPRRWDFGVGLFHFKNYYSSQVSTLGEQFDSARLFSERNFGLLVQTSYPFDRFRRAEIDFTQMFVERTFYDEDALGNLLEGEKEFRSVSSPSLSLVGDNALFGYYGPVNGGRYNLTFSPSFAWFANGLSFRTVSLDARRYWDLTNGYTFAGRVLLGASGGRDPQIFRVGGFSTLRGYPDFDLFGSRVAIVNAELRFPFIQQLGVVGPVPLGLFNLRGALFADVGLVWNQGDKLRFSYVLDGRRRLDDPRFGFGAGVRTALWFLIAKLDAGWNTDFAGVSHPRWHFSIGPEF